MEFEKEKSNVLHMSRIKPFIITAVDRQTEIGVLLKGPGHSGWTLYLAGARSTLTVKNAWPIFVHRMKSSARRQSGCFSHQCR